MKKSFKQYLKEDEDVLFKVKDNLDKWIHDDDLVNYRETLNDVLELVNNGKYIEASKKFNDTDLRYELPQTGTLLKDLADDEHTSSTIGKDWGTKAGVYTVYRSGHTDNNPNGIFFSPYEEDAKAYSQGTRPTYKYEVTIKNPLVATNANELIAKLNQSNIGEIKEIPLKMWLRLTMRLIPK
jgi:hypothetical protein